MKRIYSIILILALFLCACAQTPNPPDNSETIPAPGIEQPAPQEPPTSGKPKLLSADPIEPEFPLSEKEKTVTALLSAMTIEEKVGQLFFVRCPASRQVEKISEYHLGGYLLFTRDFQNSAGEWLSEEEFTAKIASYQAAATIPLLIGVDEEGGSVARASRNPNLFPVKRKSPQTIFRNGGMEAILQDTLDVNSRLLSLGINVNFAPVADVSTNRSDFIFDRTFGRDAAQTAQYIAAVVSQMNECRVGDETRVIGSVLKHFPGYGNNIDTHTGIAVDTRAYETFVSEDFLPFIAGMEAGVGAVLVSHNIVTCMDASLPASLSAQVHRILREELGFDGVIITDDLAMDAVKQYAKNGQAAVLALLSGNSMIVTTDFETQIGQVLTALENGELTARIIDSAVYDVLNWKYDLGLLGE